MAEPRHPEAGVTLIEMLVALALIAAGASVVALALPDRASERSVAQEAALFAARLDLASERSLVEGRSFRLTWDAAGYGFARWETATEDEEAGWRPSQDATLPTRHALEAGARLQTARGPEEGTFVIGPDLLPPEGGALGWQVAGDAAAVALRFDGLRATTEAGR